jgi:CRISPR-associated protein Csb2
MQALVAGVARGRRMPDKVVAAVEWLEGLPPPLVVAPRRTLGQAISLYVPNNDADSPQADPRDVSAIRTVKRVQPSLFAADQCLLYAWLMVEDSPHAKVIAEAANHLYQLGRGIDTAWAVAEVVDDIALHERLTQHCGIAYHPRAGAAGQRNLSCPTRGSLASLMLRHGAQKLHADRSGRNPRTLFANPPKPRFTNVSYAPARRFVMFDLLGRWQPRPWPWALNRASALTEKLRNAAAARLEAGLGQDARESIELSLIGRTLDGSGAVPVAQRVHIFPLPSIGSEHADRGIRRVVVEVPGESLVSAADVEWAFSGLDWVDSDTGELSPLVVTKSVDFDMLGHYRGPSRRWRSVTAVVLPAMARRRCLTPNRIAQEVKDANERIAEEHRAVDAVAAALRHAGVRATAKRVRVQREPFEAKGSRAEAFAAGTRFAKDRLWHVEIELDRVFDGPLAIGDGRFVGLGIMAPMAEPQATDGVFSFQVIGSPAESPIALARALRRAVMARVRDTLDLAPDAGLDRFFSGHERDGAKAGADSPEHLAYQWDAPRRRMVMIAPHQLARRAPRRHERKQLRVLDHGSRPSKWCSSTGAGQAA